MKKLFLFIFAAMLAGQVWAYDFKSGSLYYTITSSSEPYTVEVASGGTDTVIIPESVNYDGNKYAVTGIGQRAFYNNNTLISITIPNTVTNIASEAFYSCTGLKSIILPESITTGIAKNAFSGSFSRSQKIYCISSNANLYSGYYGNTNATVVRGAKIVNDYVYLITGSEPYTVAVSGYIGNDKSLVIPEKVTIDEIKYSVTSIGNSAFDCCYNLLSISLPNTIVSIGEYAFNDCRCLTTINIPNSVTSIGKYAFNGCCSVVSVTIPNTVASAGENSFYGWSSNQKIYCISTSRPNGWYYNWYTEATVVWGAKFVDDFVCHITNSDPCTAEIAGYIGNDTEISVPEMVTINNIEYAITSISSNVFNGVMNVIYSGDVEGCPWGATYANHTIDGDFIFSDANKTNLVEYLGNDKNVIIPNSVISIGKNVFKGNNVLSSISIPNSVKTIENNTFSGCDSLTSITIGGYTDFSNASLYFTKDGIRYMVLDKGSVNVASNQYSGTITIPDTVSAGNSFAVVGIDANAFNNSSVTSIILPETMTNIDGNAFKECYELRYNEYKNACYLGSEKNQYYVLIKTKSYDINSCEINNNCKVIASYAFNNNHNLESITIPESVEFISQDAVNLGYKVWDGRTTEIHYGRVYCITDSKPDGWSDGWYTGNSTIVAWGAKFVGDYVCRITDTAKHEIEISNYSKNNYSIIEFIVPETIKFDDTEYTVVSIGDNAFNNCLRSDYLTIHIPNTIRSIGEHAFSDCYYKTVIIPSSVKNIGVEAFSCSATFYCEPKNKPEGWVNYSYFDYTYYEERQFAWNNNYGTVVWGTKYDNGILYQIKSDDSEGAVIINCIQIDTALTIPAKVTINGVERTVTGATNSAFNNCHNLKSVIIESDANFSNASLCFTKDSICYRVLNKDSVEVTQLREYHSDFGWYSDNAYSGSVTIPETVTAGNTFAVTGIDRNAFSSCHSLTSVTIPESIASIGNQAFYDCESLTSISIPKSVTCIGYHAFVGSNITIYCEVSSKPDGWDEQWAADGCNVVWTKSNNTTAVTESAANTVNIYALGNTIIVENATEEIRVYNAMGALVGCVGRDVPWRVSTGTTTITINTSGVYIVKTGGVVKRVMVN